MTTWASPRPSRRMTKDTLLNRRKRWSQPATTIFWPTRVGKSTDQTRSIGHLDERARLWSMRTTGARGATALRSVPRARPWPAEDGRLYALDHGSEPSEFK